MKVYLINLFLLITGFYSYSYIKMPGEVRRIQSARVDQEERYTAIKVERDLVYKIITFWAPRISEGLRICSQLANNVLSHKALSLKNKMNRFVHNKAIERASIEELQEIMPILAEIRDYYQQFVCHPGSTQQWSMLARHFLVELDYVFDLLSDIKYSRLATIQFLNRLNIAHIWLIKNLLISSANQRCLIKQAFYFMHHAKKWHCETELLSYTIDILSEFCDYYDLLRERLDKGILEAKISKALFLDLIEHFFTIAQYTQQELSALKNRFC